MVGVTSANPDLADIRTRGALRVIVSADELPEMFSFGASGAPGLEREIVEGFARAHGLAVEVIKAPVFEQVIPMLIAGEGDLVVGLIATDERRERIAFTVETMPARHVAVTRLPVARIDSVGTLLSQLVGVVNDSSWEAAAIQAGVPAEKRVGYGGAEQMLAALGRGDVDAVVMSVTDYALSQASDPKLQAGCFVGSVSSAAWGVRQQDDALRLALDQHISRLQRSPAWSSLVLRYYSQETLGLIARARQE
jgi:ABC-type amino acid transport substrate-binding protein